MKFTISLEQLIVSKCLVCCSPFQINAELLEDVVTGLLYSHLTMALIIPGDCCCCKQQINVLTQPGKEKDEIWVFSLLPCNKAFCSGSQAFKIFSPVAYFSTNLRSTPIVELIHKTQKRVDQIPYVMVNLCLYWAGQNGLESECLHGQVWAFCFVFSL